MEIWFYDITASQELVHLNGQTLTLEELYTQRMSLRPPWQPTLSMSELLGIRFHPYADNGDGWKSWESCLSTMIQLISGHTPSKDELRIIRGYIRKLPNDFKRSHVDHRFVLTFVSYLFAGFKANPFSGFTSESNTTEALCEFTIALCTTRKCLFSSFLCAHRDPKVGESLNLLQSRIPPHKVRRSAALTLALAHNANTQVRGRALFLQQPVSMFATSSVFPEVTAVYLEEDRAHELIGLLGYQYNLVSDTLRGLPGERVSAKLMPLDVLTSRILRFLDERFGTDWRQQDFTSSRFEQDQLVQIAIDAALPDIQRLMPFFSGDLQSAFLSRKEEILSKNVASAYQIGGQELADVVAQTIAWFLLQHSMTISAKAIYETTFYYLWGLYCGKFDGVFAIGFDRNHDAFQHLAWKLGAESSGERRIAHQTVPLYARRNPSGREHGSLVDLSFRQFWRYE